MSNAVVPQIYSWIISQTIELLEPQFTEMGIDTHVLQDLHQNWDERIRASHVAMFPQLMESQSIGLPYGYTMPQLDRQILALDGNEGIPELSADRKLRRRSRKPLNIAQNDGQDDDEDEESAELCDSDNINSELDDDDSQDDLETEHLMLCQYEKVSRVKNKWKCILKDGIVSVHGKDYLFNRVLRSNQANGDFEW